MVDYMTELDWMLVSDGIPSLVTISTPLCIVCRARERNIFIGGASDMWQRKTSTKNTLLDREVWWGGGWAWVGA
ncbi:hypothetical protein Hanom_Chr09g00853501 [Helianthus anomalus]